MLKEIPDDYFMRWFNEQAKFMRSVNVGLAQQALELRKNNLAHVEALVDSMRMVPLGVSALQTVTRVATATLQQDLQTATQVFASLSTQVFEDLRRAQETWLEIVCFSDEFVRLQSMLGTNLLQLLHEQAAYYQTWQDGEYDTFTEAFVLCADYLFYRALGVLHDSEDARDVVQDTYEKALRKLQTYSIERIRHLNVRPWLSQIVKTTALNFLRDQRRCDPYEMSWMAQRPGSRFDQPEAILVRQELLQLLYESFQALPAIQHKIIFMRYFGAESSLNEIADYLACPLGTVKGNLSRGLRTLRQRLADQNLSTIEFEGLIDTLPSWPYCVDYSGQQSEAWEE